MFNSIRRERRVFQCRTCMESSWFVVPQDEVAKALQASETELINSLGDPVFAPARYYLKENYPQLSPSGENRYIHELHAQSLVDSASTVINTLLEMRNDFVQVLKLDITPPGARVKMWALTGPPHESVANFPLDGLTLGLYDYEVRVNNVVVARGLIDLIKNKGRTLWCRLDTPQFANSGCSQKLP